MPEQAGYELVLSIEEAKKNLAALTKEIDKAVEKAQKNISGGIARGFKNGKSAAKIDVDTAQAQKDIGNLEKGIDQLITVMGRIRGGNALKDFRREFNSLAAEIKSKSASFNTRMFAGEVDKGAVASLRERLRILQQVAVEEASIADARKRYSAALTQQQKEKEAREAKAAKQAAQTAKDKTKIVIEVTADATAAQKTIDRLIQRAKQLQGRGGNAAFNAKLGDVITQGQGMEATLANAGKLTAELNGIVAAERAAARAAKEAAAAAQGYKSTVDGLITSLKQMETALPAKQAKEIATLRAKLELDPTSIGKTAADVRNAVQKGMKDANKGVRIDIGADSAIGNIKSRLQRDLSRTGFDGASLLFGDDARKRAEQMAKDATDRIEQIRAQSSTKSAARVKQEIDEVTSQYKRESQAFLQQQLVKDGARARDASKQNLAFSRIFQVQQAVEDFSYAGLRGAGNNIALLLSQMGKFGAIGLGAITVATAGWIAYKAVVGDTNDILDESLKKQEKLRDLRDKDFRGRANPKFQTAEDQTENQVNLRATRRTTQELQEQLRLLERLKIARQSQAALERKAQLQGLVPGAPGQKTTLEEAKKFGDEATRIQRKLRDLGVEGLNGGILSEFSDGTLNKAIEETNKQLEDSSHKAKEAEDEFRRGEDDRLQRIGLIKNAVKEVTDELEKQKQEVQDLLAKEIQRAQAIKDAAQSSQRDFQDRTVSAQQQFKNNTIDRQAQEVVERERQAVQRYIRQKYGSYEGINPFWENLRSKEEQAGQRYIESFERMVQRVADREKLAAAKRAQALNAANFTQRANASGQAAEQAAGGGEFEKAQKLLEDRIQQLTKLRDMYNEIATAKQTPFDKEGEKNSRDALQKAAETQDLINKTFQQQQEYAARAQDKFRADLAEIQAKLTEVGDIKKIIGDIDLIQQKDIDKLNDILGKLAAISDAKNRIARGGEIAQDPVGNALPNNQQPPGFIKDARGRGVGFPIPKPQPPAPVPAKPVLPPPLPGQLRDKDGNRIGRTPAEEAKIEAARKASAEAEKQAKKAAAERARQANMPGRKFDEDGEPVGQRTPQQKVQDLTKQIDNLKAKAAAQRKADIAADPNGAIAGEAGLPQDQRGVFSEDELAIQDEITKKTNEMAKARLDILKNQDKAKMAAGQEARAAQKAAEAQKAQGDEMVGAEKQVEDIRKKREAAKNPNAGLPSEATKTNDQRVRDTLAKAREEAKNFPNANTGVSKEEIEKRIQQRNADAVEASKKAAAERDARQDNIKANGDRMRKLLQGADGRKAADDARQLQQGAQAAGQTAAEKQRAGATSVATPGDVEQLNAAAAAARAVVQAKQQAAAISVGGGGTSAPIASPGTPGRAIGGPVGSGSTYMVGERGPELFTPNRTGYISSATATQGILSAAASISQPPAGQTNSVVSTDNSSSIGNVSINNFGRGTTPAQVAKYLKQEQKSNRIKRGRV